MVLSTAELSSLSAVGRGLSVRRGTLVVKLCPWRTLQTSDELLNWVEVVPGAGHAVQSDQPLELVRLINDFVFA